MALATSTAAALWAAAAAAAAAGVSQHNTNRTISRQDREQAAGIQRQSRIQQRADQQVNTEVDALENSTAADERSARMAEYMKTLGAARNKTEGGLENDALGDAFSASAQAAKGDLKTKGETTANLMAGVDAAGLQRQGEAFRFGNLATDIGLIGRESAGQQFLTDLRTRSIRRNPYLDATAAGLQGAAGGLAGAGTGAASSAMTQPTTQQLIAAMRGMGA